MRSFAEAVVLGVVLLATLLGVSFVAETGETFSGFLTTQHEATVSIAEATEGTIRRFDFDRVITRGESVNMSVEVKNSGSTPISAYWDIYIYDANGTLRHSYPAPNESIMPGAFHGYTVKHTPHEVGSYTVTLDAQIGGDRVRTTRFLFVNAKPTVNLTEPEPRVITITRRRIRYVYADQPDTDEPDPTSSWRIDAPQEVSVPQGGSTSFPIAIDATGTASIEDISLTTQFGGNLSVRYSPQILFGIAPNESKAFLVTVEAANTTMEDQQITYTVASSQLTETRQVNVDVTPVYTIGQLESEIERLQWLLIKARSQTDTAERRGMDVSTVRNSLQTATTALDEATATLDSEDFATTRSEIADAREAIDTAYTRLLNLESQQLVVQAPLIRPIHVLVLFAILAAFGMVGAYYYFREKHNRRPKLLREAEE